MYPTSMSCIIFNFYSVARGEEVKGIPACKGGGVGEAEVGVYLLEVFLKETVISCTV